MKKHLPKVLLLCLSASSSLYASDEKIDSQNPIIALQEQIQDLQQEINTIDSDNNSPTLYTYSSVVDDDKNAEQLLKERRALKNIDLMKNISVDGDIINLTDGGVNNIFGNGDGVDVSNSAPITTRGEVSYLGSYSGNNNIPIGMLPSKLFASSLVTQKEKFDDYSIFLGGFIGMDAQTWYGDNIPRMNFDGTPTSSFNGSGQNIYLTSSRLYFLSNLGDYVTAEYDVSTNELQQFFIGNAFVIFGNMSASPFFVTVGRSTLSVASIGGGGSSTGSIADFLGTGRATNISLNYKTSTLNASIAVFGTDDKKANFSTGLFYADSWTDNLSVGFNAGYVYDLNGAENFTIESVVSDGKTVGVFNIDTNIAYTIGGGVFQINTGWGTTTGKDNFNGDGNDVLTGAWYVGTNYSLSLAGRSTNFNATYGQSYNAAAIPMGIAASPLQDGLAQTGIEKQLIFSAQRAYFDDYVLFGPEYAYQRFYDGRHMNTLTLDLAVYL
ncbi:DUF3573 domain-containing protein [Francisella sp. Scap27]|uniref:DUF3573 domain-containing protein n=1 Tax=Francisella sp. Scap27 TaxID=2589986 RepID=UPI0015C1B9E7|nr:DUF3573 domain-containing protein [Francisella sp. Scap27]QLE78882.1 DUF3573 domain-containing protein [Francisella sp. Scap27]